MRTRMKVLSVLLVAPLAVTALAGCGGSNATNIRESAVSELTKQMSDSGMPQEMIDCATAAINGLSDDDVVALDNETASQDVQDKFNADVAACATAGG